MKINNLGKIAGAAVVADVLLNGGRGTKKAATTGCGCYILSIIFIASPFIWILHDCL